MLQFGGYQKLTLLDYPGKIACTVFLGSCNFRCPFCHNSELFTPTETYPEEDILAMIKKRAGVLEGVAITGGEPTLHAGLADFMRRVHELGLKVKLDSNGYRPEVLEKLFAEGLVDYIAMDIKSSPAHYGEVAGLPGIDIEKIKRSVELIKNSGIDFEFRTTVIPELHGEEDFIEIGKWLGDVPYFLQAYKDSDMVYEREFSEPNMTLMESIRTLVLPFVPRVQIRGVE